MPPTADEARRRLGFFGPFMAAWRRATDAEHAALADAEVAYRAGQLTEADYVATVERQLGLKVPMLRA